MARVRILISWLAGLAVTDLLSGAIVYAQSAPSAWGAGQSLWVGAEYSYMQAGFPVDSSVHLSGIGAFVNYNWNHRFGVEGQARFLNLSSWNGETEQDYLAGPRYTFLHSNKWRPFAGFQAGIVNIHYPFELGSGNSFAVAPGGGLEYRFGRKWSIRAGYEYQFLFDKPSFTSEPSFGLKPRGASGGISYRIF